MFSNNSKSYPLQPVPLPFARDGGNSSNALYSCYVGLFPWSATDFSQVTSFLPHLSHISAS